MFPSEKVLLELLDIINDEDLNIYREAGHQPINLGQKMKPSVGSTNTTTAEKRFLKCVKHQELQETVERACGKKPILYAPLCCSIFG